ncbi:thiamine phosphate synthase [Echinicola soli]|uniref:Thiamine-phosphate synthase n=1 Tax=Echinicola soli TaxID=2591634 RepID=A0A514CKR7_9BACT|nr:thiamine phosphate synthase [Echinicola soli]QDH80392.1 thiamine phosphate synthase [Echinicola soli]
MSTISFLHYITPNLDHPKDYLDTIQTYGEAGGKWVQLRMKAFPKSVILRTAYRAKEICDVFGCSLIINDHPEIAHKSGAYGVHVGKNDKSVEDIRERYGNRMVIGATANTLEDILAAANTADYIGLGPFRFTSTKKDLSKILGITGYQVIMDKVKTMFPDLPIIAIGGIISEDLASLKAIGLDGVAVSGLLHQSETPQELIKEIKNTFDYVDHCQ